MLICSYLGINKSDLYVNINSEHDLGIQLHFKDAF